MEIKSSLSSLIQGTQKEHKNRMLSWRSLLSITPLFSMGIYATRSSYIHLPLPARGWTPHSRCFTIQPGATDVCTDCRMLYRRGEPLMEFAFTAEEQAFREDIRQFLRDHPPETFPHEGMDA